MLVGLGPFRFTVPTFTLDELDRTAGGRVAQQEVIGAAPRTHLLGPSARSFTIASTFHPLHLNRAGGLMLEGVCLASERQTPLLFVSILGRVYGRFVIERVNSRQTQYAPGGIPQTVTAQIDITSYVT